MPTVLPERIESSGKRVFKSHNKTAKRGITALEVETREARRREADKERRQRIKGAASSRALACRLDETEQ